MTGVVTAIAVVAGTAYNIYSGERAASMQRDAQRKAEAQAKSDEMMADEARNRSNRKKPDTAAILDAAMQAGKTGGSSTLLSGPGGAGSTLGGGNTLLGG